MSKIEWAKLIARTVIAIIKTDKIPTNKKFKAIVGVPSAVKELKRILKTQMEAREYNPDEGWKDQ